MYEEKNRALLEHDKQILEKIDQEFTDFLNSNFKTFRELMDRDIETSVMEDGLDILSSKTSAFQRSVKKTSKKLRYKYYKTITFIIFIILCILSLMYAFRSV